MATPISKPVQLAQNAPVEDELIQLGIDPLEVDQMISENNPYEDPVLNEQFRQSALKSYTQSVTNANTPKQPEIQQNDASIYDAMLRSMGEQENYTKQLKKRLKDREEEGNFQYLDLRPFAQSLRSYGVGVEDTAAPMDREATMQALQDKIQQATSGLTKQQVDYLRTKALQAAKEKSSSLQEQKFELQKKKAADVQTRFEQTYGLKLTGRAVTATKNYIDRWDTLEREVSTIENSENFNAPMFASAQTTIKNAISSLPGGGTGEERKKQYLENLNTIMSEFKGKFTNDLDTISRNSPEVRHLLNLAKIVKADLGKQAMRKAESSMQASPEAFKEDLKLRLEEDQKTSAKEDPLLKQIEESKKRIQQQMDVLNKNKKSKQ
jgi:hypothetical protein